MAAPCPVQPLPFSMVIESLINHNFLEAPKDYGILADFHANSKKLIALEVADSLTFRYLDSIQSEDLAVRNKSTALSLPVLLEPFPVAGCALWKLPTWSHIKWTTQALAPVFALNLDSLNSISNATKIYCLWLKNPETRPAGVTEDKLEEFIELILFDLAELFESRKVSDTKSSQSVKRHIELCQLVIKTIIHDLIPSSPLFAQKASRSWNLITRLFLGITDNLLWADKQNYLADELAELLLNSLFFLILQSGIYCDELWKKFASCFKLWCHRLKSILTWGNVLTALNAQVAKFLFSTEPENTFDLVFGMHSANYRVNIDSKFANFSWIRITNLLPKISGLSGDVFLRALQALDKIVATWLTAGESSGIIYYDSRIDRKIPDANTLLEIYGDLIFESAMIEKPSHEQGRSIAISIICRILSKWQYRELISEAYLSTCCSCLKSALAGESLASATALYCLEPVLVSGHCGIFCLIPPTFLAIRNIVPKGKLQKSPLHNISFETLRMCSYRLLGLIYSFFSENDCPVSLKLVKLDDLKSIGHSASAHIFKCYSSSLSNPSVLLKAHILDTLIGSLYIEDNANNIRLLLNSISALLYTDNLEFPELFPFLCSCFESILCKPPAIWVFPPPVYADTQITIVRILEQWSRLRPLDPAQSQSICMSMISLITALHSKSNLPLYFRLIISIYESLFSWLSVSCAPYQCVAAFISALVRFMNEPVPFKSSVSKVSSVAAAATSSSANTSALASPPVMGSPTLYGIKNRKSLSERVFTLEYGHEDQRPGGLSPTLLKGVDEIFLECTDSILQRLLCLLLQDQINSNHPVKLDSLCDDFNFGSGNVKYFALSSSIIIGFSNSLIFVRNSIGKFTWRHEFKISNSGESTLEETIEESSIIIDHDRPDKVKLFNSPLVTTTTEEDDEEMLILNDSNWTKTLNNNPKIAAKLSPIISEAESHLTNDLIPNISLKSCLNRVKPQKPVHIENETEIISRLFLSHFGFLNSSTHALVSPLNPTDSLISDLKKLDSLPARESFNIPIHFVPSNYRTVPGEAVSKSFEAFVKGLGSFCESSNGPIFTVDSSLQVQFPLIPRGQDSFGLNESVSIIWSEDAETLQSLPNSPSNFLHLLVTPVLINRTEKGHFFRIRIILTRALQPEYNSLQNISNSFGPILDGMIVKKSALSQLIRETSIFAHRFISQYIENSPNPVMKRQSLLKSIIFKHYKMSANSYGSLINDMIN